MRHTERRTARSITETPYQQRSSHRRRKQTHNQGARATPDRQRSNHHHRTLLKLGAGETQAQHRPNHRRTTPHYFGEDPAPNPRRHSPHHDTVRYPGEKEVADPTPPQHNCDLQDTMPTPILRHRMKHRRSVQEPGKNERGTSLRHRTQYPRSAQATGSNTSAAGISKNTSQLYFGSAHCLASASMCTSTAHIPRTMFLVP